MSIIIFLIILSLLVIVHELGHFLVARRFGIKVEEFGIGLPPKALKIFTWKGTPFTLNWLPFGGFVKIFGENADTQVSDSESFQSKNRWIQASVLVAGVFGNFIFAWFLFAIGLMIGMPGEILGLSGEGIVQLFPHEAIWQGLKVTAELTLLTGQALIQFIVEAVSGSADFSSVSGPVGIVGLIGEASALGFVYLMVFTAIISINLAIINLLPFPALDGGRLLFVGIEAIIRRPVPPRLFQIVNAIGFIILLGLMALVTGNDILKLL